MPTYEFRCPQGHDFEKFFRKISDAQMELPCPVCGEMAQRRLSAGAGLLFKGSGFYLTDYGRNAHRGGSGSGGSGSSGSSGSAGGSSGASGSGGTSGGGASSGGASSGGSGSGGSGSGGGASGGTGGASGSAA